MTILETERLMLRELEAGDAEFVLELLNEPAFLKNIGDRHVRTLADAVAYVANGPAESYKKFGFGLNLVAIAATAEPIGICGLLKREFLADPDIGFAFLARHWGRGYAYEAATAVMRHGREVLGVQRILAITSPENHSSAKVLGRIGLRFEKMLRIPGRNDESKLFVSDCVTV